MAIKIYTYANPYEIDCEPFWNEIKDCAHFCVSQTMVNGLNKTYPNFEKKQLTATIRSLVNALYENWEDININVRQIMEVDSTINNLSLDSPSLENVKRSLLFNTKSIVSCVRMFKELGLDSENLSKNNLNINQQYLVEVYRSIDKREESAFIFERIGTLDKVNIAIEKALTYKSTDIDLSKINTDTIIIHGIHQFTPAILCAIEDISRFKDVILLFNYQKQYDALYETWMNIYSIFDLPINNQSNNQFVPMSLLVNSYRCNVLADYMGNLANGDFIEKNKVLDDLEVIEFENTTEFANYVAMIFDRAKNASDKLGTKTPVAFMSEQLYSASSKVNDILRAYFPDQFGERHFLDYPIGHFFVSTTNMWDEVNNEVKVENFSDIKECLNSGIIYESKSGQLVSTFNMVEPYIEKENTIDGMCKKINKLINNSRNKNEDKEKVGYFNIKAEQLSELKKALTELNSIIISFFNDFENGSDNFRRFYCRIRKFIISRISDLKELDDEMHVVIEKLLGRLEQSELPETGTFNCLKQTMNYYLSQDDKVAMGSKWIVRGFDQIDGDILRSAKQNPEKICYHFCCLSDNDMCSNKDERLPWPLDIKFFEYSYPALEWKYQVFLKSKMEYHNFKKYALLYGLEFNRIGCKLSYVKNDNNKDNDLFYMLSLLGIRIKKYSSFDSNNYIEKLKIEQENDKTVDELISQIDDISRMKWSICPYRFALEGIEQGKTVFRDRFLIHMYLRILIGNRTKKELSGKPYSNDILERAIQDQYDVIESRFRISDELEKTQLISAVYTDMLQFIKKMKRYNRNKNNFPIISGNMNDQMRISEHFLNIPLTNSESILSDEQLKEIIKDKKFYCLHGKHCKYCASKDICLEHGANNGGE
ncbi:hypothetical protein ACTQ31_08695 [Clostridium butyricum]|uniref:hypothetical protein n=1 Tax=Clostridium butyricum TaxID=1492 RepID=UPI003F91D25A